MKICLIKSCLIVLFGGLFTISAMAQAESVVFECSAKIEEYNFAVKVTKVSNGYESYFVGASYPGPEKTVHEVMSLSEARKRAGVNPLMKILNLSDAELKTISRVHIYTAGNFDDDAAGVRSVLFLDSSGHDLIKGMIFGWAGPMRCQ